MKLITWGCLGAAVLVSVVSQPDRKLSEPIDYEDAWFRHAGIVEAEGIMRLEVQFLRNNPDVPTSILDQVEGYLDEAKKYADRVGELFDEYDQADDQGEWWFDHNQTFDIWLDFGEAEIDKAYDRLQDAWAFLDLSARGP